MMTTIHLPVQMSPWWAGVATAGSTDDMGTYFEDLTNKTQISVSTFDDNKVTTIQGRGNLRLWLCDVPQVVVEVFLERCFKFCGCESSRLGIWVKAAASGTTV